MGGGDPPCCPQTRSRHDWNTEWYQTQSTGLIFYDTGNNHNPHPPTLTHSLIPGALTLQIDNYYGPLHRSDLQSRPHAVTAATKMDTMERSHTQAAPLIPTQTQPTTLDGPKTHHNLVTLPTSCTTLPGGRKRWQRKEMECPLQKQGPYKRRVAHSLAAVVWVFRQLLVTHPPVVLWARSHGRLSGGLIAFIAIMTLPTDFAQRCCFNPIFRDTLPTPFPVLLHE